MTTAVDRKADFLVWSNQHGAWWRPNGQGYTTRLEDAGRYTEEDADSACKSGGAGSNVAPPEEIKVRAPEYEYLRHRDPLAAVKLRHGYSGSDWIKLQLGYRKEREAVRKPKKDPIPYEMSEFGATVADILGYVFRGIYHMDHKALERVDWSKNYVDVKLGRCCNLATYDSQELTELVIMCHDHAIRFAVKAEFSGQLLLSFHKRKRIGERYYERHPTIEEAIKNVRSVEE